MKGLGCIYQNEKIDQQRRFCSFDHFELVFLINDSEQATLLYRFAKLTLKRVLVFCEVPF